MVQPGGETRIQGQHLLMNTIVSASSSVLFPKVNATENTVLNQGESRGVPAISCRCSTGFLELLQRLEISLLVTSARGGRMLTLGVQNQRLSVTTLEQSQPTGIAANEHRIAVAVEGQVQIYASPAISAASHQRRAVQLQGNGSMSYRAQRSIHIEGSVSPSLGWGKEGLWMVNTGLSCLSLLTESGDSIVGWKPPFISSIADEDRCHLNGVAIFDGRPRYVTALGSTDEPYGWQAEPFQSGVLIDVPTGAVIADSLIVPRSPRLHDGKLYLLQSWIGELSMVDGRTGAVESIETFPGYAGGMDCWDGYAFVGLSRSANLDLPGDRGISVRNDLACGIAVVNLRTGKIEEALNFLSGIDEVTDIAVLPTCSPSVL